MKKKTGLALIAGGSARGSAAGVNNGIVWIAYFIVWVLERKRS
jgi:hypothetical protein